MCATLSSIAARLTRLRPVVLFASIALLALATSVAQAAPARADAPRTSHAVEGREDCLACHQVGSGARPSPASHAAYANAMCLGCHPAAEATGAKLGAATTTPPPPQAQATPAGPAAQASPTPTAAPKAATEADCLGCHASRTLATLLPSGERLSVYVDEAGVAGSVHQGKVGCLVCHPSATALPHPPVTAADRRAYSAARNEVCKTCHAASDARTPSDVHYQAARSGNPAAPLCGDCHGYHDVPPAKHARASNSARCGACHGEVYAAYSRSVHGAALQPTGARIADVPACTDCHGAHSVGDTDRAAFRMNSPELCATCHADANLMAEYGLSANVAKTYAQDFHGATVALVKRQGPDAQSNKAVCVDCHGVHDVKSTRRGDPAAIRQQVLAACQKCHPDAGSNYPDAWLGHYELSLATAPLPWLVRAWYVVFIPFMVGGLALHIVADIWRASRRDSSER